MENSENNTFFIIHLIFHLNLYGMFHYIMIYLAKKNFEIFHNYLLVTPDMFSWSVKLRKQDTK